MHRSHKARYSSKTRSKDAYVLYSISYQLISRCLSPSEVDVRWEDGVRAIWWVRRGRAVREESWLEWLDGISNQQAVVILAKSLAPELIKDAASEQRNVLIYATAKSLLTLVSLVNAFKMGFV